ncbi:class I SAM-dependent methyltransferase [Larkinella rosea]|uniref:Class I SAM-dependent methyltransferase n=1 Tax=Larkinella rosea TaxID=2025312 RepID=A0A3P1C8N9_9BACT|nr:class I SAM-dependent methyltransferase [Larkinella rosea]RRB09376.1 class I SAM-dependent methyltransferase [Larkinella rosea]
MILESVIPWGRSLDEYRRMFSLTESDLTKTVLGVGDGPASFNIEMQELGHSMVSIDPIYAFSAEEIASRIEQTYDTVLEQVRLNADQFNWSDFRNPDDLGEQRMRAMKRFLADYETGKQQGRYRVQSLPTLSFPDQSFDLALCSHFLFLYTAHLSEDFHLQAIHELMRVASEVRIFPILDLTGQLSPYVKTVTRECQKSGFSVEQIEVPYHFQKNGNQMLCITKKASNP